MQQQQMMQTMWQMSLTNPQSAMFTQQLMQTPPHQLQYLMNN